MLAACGTTLSPTANLPATATPLPTPTPTPSAIPLPSPTAFVCPPLPTAMGASLHVPTATGTVDIPLESGALVPVEPSYPPVDPADVVVEGTVLGGTEIEAEISFDIDVEPLQLSAAITGAAARFVPLAGVPVADVDVVMDGTTLTLKVPDKDAVGRLYVSLDWDTACGADTGGGSTVLTVANSASAAGCPTTTDEVDASFQEFADGRITIGGISEPLDIYGWSTRWTLGNGVTDFGTLFPNWDRDTVITVAPEGLVAVREKIDELQLVSVRASIYTRADVDTYVETDEFPDPVTVVRRNVNPNGNVNIPAPLEPGSYVFDIDATWLTSCFELNTTRTVSVKVS